ncbi:MAG: hypothetical protein MK100_02160 [Phycisphaerales bacterium]|nr:hypothetical protein [Phycisphaerales bacterium]
MHLSVSLMMVCSGLLAVSAPHDPTSPADVGKLAPPPPADAPLAGPEVNETEAGGGAGEQRGMGGSMMLAGPMGILMAHCSSCHGPDKQKGGVRVAPIDALFEVDRQDWVVIPGHPDQSVLFQRVILPAGHDDIMPPTGPPLSSTDIETLRAWIAGAKTSEELVKHARAAATKSSSGVDPRDWMTAYMSIELTSKQRSEGMKLSMELRQQARKRTDASRKNDQAQGRPTDSEQRARREAREEIQRAVSAAQEKLWTALSADQKKAMQALLADPEALEKARQNLRQRMRGNGDQRRGRPSAPR